MLGCGCFFGASILVIILAALVFIGLFLLLGMGALVLLVGPILLVISFLIIRWLWDLFW
ncbi:MAG: hypothetical protein ACRCWD_08245 [Culicoidibacterales bacterium]